MILATSKLVVRFFLGISLLALTAAFSMYIWIITGPRSITVLNPYIEKSLNAFATAHTVKINTTVLIWDKDQQTVDLRARGIKIFNDDGTPIVALPEISIGLSMAQLIRGHIEPTNLTILNSALKIPLHTPQENTDGSLDLYKEFVKELYAIAHTPLSKKGLNNIHIRDANILLANDDKNGQNALLHITNATITFLTQNNTTLITSEVRAVFEEKPVNFRILLEQDDAETYNAHIEFNQLPVTRILTLFPQSEILGKTNLTASGKIMARLPKDRQPSLEGINITHLAGTYSHPTYLPHPITITDLQAQTHFIHDSSKLAIDDAVLTVENASQLELKGFIKHDHFSPEELLLQATARNVPVGEIFRYWPQQLGDTPRQWVTERISGGNVPEATIKLWLTNNDIALKRIPETALEAKVTFEDASVDFYEEYPPAHQVNGVASFSGNNIDIQITGGTILNSQISEASVTMPDIHEKKIIIIKGKARGPIADTTKFFNTQPVSETLQTSLTEINGQAETSVTLTIPMQKSLTLHDMDITILSKLSSVELPHLFNRYDVKGEQFLLGFNQNILTLSGTASFNDVPLMINLQQHLTPDKQDVLGRYNIQATLLPEDRKKLLIPDIPYVKGKVTGILNVTQKTDQRLIKLSGDLTNTTIDLSDFGWTKQAGQKAELSLYAVDALKDTLSIPEFSLHAQGFSAKGRAVVEKDFSAFDNIDLQNIRTGRNNFSFIYSTTDNANTLRISGKSLDLSQADLMALLSSTGNASHPKTLRATIALDTLYLKNDETLAFVKAKLQCAVTHCHSANASAHIPESDERIDISLTPLSNTKSHFLVQAGDAGRVLRGLHFYERMKGGWLNIDGYIEHRLNDTTKQPYNFVKGILKINNFTLTKTPVLAKIATLASFEGLNDLLNNKGISFKRLRTPFNLQESIITVKDLKASGASLGFTADGYINLNEGTLSMAGTFVPSYTVNNFLGKIPLVGPIGDALMGGEGEGILAARYKLKGKLDDADVSVNPLSILTPGFLRNLFDIMDAGPAIPTRKPKPALVWESLPEEKEDTNFFAISQ